MNKDNFTEKVTAAEVMLYHISKTILKNDCDCADAVQETIITAYSKLSSLRNDRFFKTWLCRILINECYKICRANKRVVALEDYMEAEYPPEQQNDLGLFDAVMELKTELRLVVVLHYIEGFQTAEMAGMLKIPEGTVKSRLSRARTELKSVLEKKEVLIHEQ
ncbi:MAG: sigma-70 family RNA polymerase sigma factor [Oscillospiraceae bacterium]|nr:sigma-70 family RNA polymerase sigma factor [Oscillospiraceae bacterium]